MTNTGNVTLTNVVLTDDKVAPTDLLLGAGDIAPLGDSSDTPANGWAVLAPGDSLVFYTDGVTEAFNSEGLMFGEERLYELVRVHGGADAQALVSVIFDSVVAFAGSAPQSDDITLAALIWNPPEVPEAGPLFF